MNGKQFFAAMEAGRQGFLRAAYEQHGGSDFTGANDIKVAEALQPMAALMGCAQLTSHMVQEERLRRGMQTRFLGVTGGAPASTAATPLPANLPVAGAYPNSLAQPLLFPTPGETRIAEALERIAVALEANNKPAWALVEKLTQVLHAPGIAEARRQDAERAA